MPVSLKERAFQRALSGGSEPRLPGQMEPLGNYPSTTDEIKQKAFERALSGADTPGVPLSERAVLSLVKENPELGVNYLKRKGYEARSNKEGDLEFKGPTGWALVNPKGLDTGDIIGVIPDLLEVAASTFASGSKAIGLVGAPASGGASLAAGAGLGGLATGAVETGRQGLGKFLGVRDEIDYGQIAKQTALGAGVPLGIGAAFMGAKAAGKGLGKMIFGGPAAKEIDAEGIKAAGKLIGAKPTPGMLADDPALRATESVLAKQTLGAGGMMLRQQLRVNERAAIDTAEALVEGRTAKSAFEVGESFADKLKQAVAEKVKPAEALYDSVKEKLKEVPADLSALKAAFKKTKDIQGLSDEAMAVVSKFEKKLDQVKTVDDLKNLRTVIMDEIPPTASKNAKIVAERLYAAATQARQDSFMAAAKEVGDTSLMNDLKKADKIYKDTIDLVQRSVLSQGQAVTKGLKRQLNETLEKTVPEKRLEKFLPKQDAGRAKALQELAPQAFDELSEARIAEIARKATSTGKGTFGVINPRTVASEIEALSPEVATKIFGQDGVLKAKALAKFYRAIPGDLNPSGTANVVDLLLFPIRQITSLSVSAVNLFLRSKEPVAKLTTFALLNDALNQAKTPKSEGQ